MIVKFLLSALLLGSSSGGGSGPMQGTVASPSTPSQGDSQTGSRCSYTGAHRATVRLLVTADGLPTKVEVAISSGIGCIDELAVQAVKQYHFPAKHISVNLQIEVNFPDTGTGTRGQ